jgi:AraC family transcriptional regulator of adaptative response/methylated-DNA-[protein]-cysteine methyltransferase
MVICMNDFTRVERIIHFLEERQEEQPALAELADVAGLSPSHLHRMFHRWAGITPKDFLQLLTLEQAKERLRASTSILETSLAVGLSGPSRLHDLFVTLEGVTPGEFKAGGKGLEIAWGLAEGIFGWCTLGWTSRGLCHLGFLDQKVVEDVPEVLRRGWPAAGFVRNDEEAAAWCRRVFSPPTDKGEPLRVYVRGSQFQVQVWRALLCIPEGRVATYGRIAEAVGRPRASRAVGTACGTNPVAWLIPCHRVIHGTGAVNGYRWGAAKKKALLVWEAARAAG